MAILKIVKDSDNILRETSKKVDKISPRIIRLLEDMNDTLLEANGAGLAAVQVGVLRRVVLVRTEPDTLYEMINPEIISSEGEQQELEGCLSLPGQWGITSRPMKVTVRAMNRNGEVYEVTGSGLTARAFCHELDHLDGVLYTDKAVHMLTDEEIRERYSDQDNDEE